MDPTTIPPGNPAQPAAPPVLPPVPTLPQEPARPALRAVDPAHPTAQDQVHELTIEALKFALAEARTAAAHAAAAAEMWKSQAADMHVSWTKERAEHQRALGIAYAQHKDLMDKFTAFVTAVSEASDHGPPAAQAPANSTEALLAQLVQAAQRRQTQQNQGGPPQNNNGQNGGR